MALQYAALLTAISAITVAFAEEVRFEGVAYGGTNDGYTNSEAATCSGGGIGGGTAIRTIVAAPINAVTQAVDAVEGAGANLIRHVLPPGMSGRPWTQRANTAASLFSSQNGMEAARSGSPIAVMENTESKPEKIFVVIDDRRSRRSDAEDLVELAGSFITSVDGHDSATFANIIAKGLNNLTGGDQDERVSRHTPEVGWHRHDGREHHEHHAHGDHHNSGDDHREPQSHGTHHDHDDHRGDDEHHGHDEHRRSQNDHSTERGRHLGAAKYGTGADFGPVLQDFVKHVNVEGSRNQGQSFRDALRVLVGSGAKRTEETYRSVEGLDGEARNLLKWMLQLLGNQEIVERTGEDTIIIEGDHNKAFVGGDREKIFAGYGTRGYPYQYTRAAPVEPLVYPGERILPMNPFTGAVERTSPMPPVVVPGEGRYGGMYEIAQPGVTFEVQPPATVLELQQQPATVSVQPQPATLYVQQERPNVSVFQEPPIIAEIGIVPEDNYVVYPIEQPIYDGRFHWDRHHRPDRHEHPFRPLHNEVDVEVEEEILRPGYRYESRLADQEARIQGELMAQAITDRNIVGTRSASRPGPYLYGSNIRRAAETNDLEEVAEEEST